MMGNMREGRSGIMRLYNIFYICKSCRADINGVTFSSVADEKNVTMVRRWGKCKASLDTLQKIECFEEKISELYKIVDWQINREDIRLPTASRADFDRTLAEIIASVETLVKLCDMLDMGKANSGIDVKIPKCSSLKEYMGYLKEIDFLFTQCPYLLSDKEEVRFSNVDVGSQWLSFVVLGSAGAFYILNNLAKLMQKAIEFKSNILVYRQQEEILAEMQQRNEVLQETVDTFKKIKQMTTDKYMRDLEEDLGELQDNEERDKVRRAVESLAVLMDKGVEIYSSIETPKEIKVLFPFEKDTAILPDNILKLIEDKKDTDE